MKSTKIIYVKRNKMIVYLLLTLIGLLYMLLLFKFSLSFLVEKKNYLKYILCSKYPIIQKFNNYNEENKSNADNFLFLNKF